MDQKDFERRRSLVVNREIQRRILFAIAFVPTLGLTLCCIIVAIFCRRLLVEATQAEAELPSLVPLLASLVAFVFVSGVVVLMQGLRFSHRVAGPIYRLTASMRRIRTGDIGFRVTLRRGDHLKELADELNLTLDWLNQNPPRGVRTGSDIVEVPLEPEQETALVASDEPAREA